jgi:hypothetical protein
MTGRKSGKVTFQSLSMMIIQPFPAGWRRGLGLVAVAVLVLLLASLAFTREAPEEERPAPRGSAP